jgi:hypothetical protein
MNSHKVSYFLKLPETLEKGVAKIICEKPYTIERTEDDNEVIWWGYNTCWKRKGEQWYELRGIKYIPCDVPEYEKIYLDINGY